MVKINMCEAAMTATTFDTLGFFEKLTSAGMPEPLARIHADTLREVIENKMAGDEKTLATKADIIALKADNTATKAEFRTALAEQKHDILRWMITTALVQTGLIIAVLRGFNVLK
jgi:hypothetical protein